ncbi:hypothetical protein ANABIO32_02130 [Rossellomorea marisflavi]|uniref:hypothetical protein n=1 Tax=Rossellomorea marisflavi TaxID=189381 RepID=UPI0025C9436F|nr:hypothetical protein [Rossellomorea marisflavi]GLI82526.1 hypothetical protein ANABIO32_02130 [Rossellomorea marisflavi]
MEIYETPHNIEELFQEVEDSHGSMSYRIINYTDGMSMDNFQSMQHFIDHVGIHSDHVDEDSGTQVILIHPEYKKRLVIDAGGLGDFFSHGYECYWEEV